jgi:copper resistance protein D
MSSALVLIRWLHFTAEIVLFGTLLFQYYGGVWCKFRELYRWVPEFSTRLRTALVVTSILVLFSSIGWLALEAGEMGDGPMDALHPEAIWAVLTGTTFGQVWQFHLAASLALVVVITTGALLRRRLDFCLLLSALLLASQAWVGHSIIEHGMGRMLHLTNNIVHFAAAGTWLGGLPSVAYLLRQIRSKDDGQVQVLTLGVLRRFSDLSFIAVILIILSGLVNSWFLVGRVDSLVATPYGQVLIAKLALFCAMLGSGAFNRLVLLPRLTSEVYRQQPLAKLFQVVIVEQMLGFLVLGIVSILGIMPPAINGL